ncbi:MAG: universal stress protein [Methylovirgula sp.]|uniref:universal stress protein n=1 Tax=Methylovirgula sp. TaxID=1978224 RepID=UPI003076418A
MALKFARRWPWSRSPEPPDPQDSAPASILLASEGAPITPEVLDFTARLSRKAHAPVHVLMIARVWGSSFGLPHPGLRPTKREWQAQRDRVAEILHQLQQRGVEATAAVVGTRNASGRILAEAKRRRPGAIVMGAPPPLHWLIAHFFWEQEPYRVRRLAEPPVYLVVGGVPATGMQSALAQNGTNGEAM